MEHAIARQSLADWRAVVKHARWRDAAAVRSAIGPSARHVGRDRFVFEIKGNDFRLVAAIRYADLTRNLNGIVYVHFVGTHADYDKIDALTVNRSTPSRRS